MKNEYNCAGGIVPTVIFSNTTYKIFYPDLQEYNFDKTTNQYISKSEEDNDKKRDQDDHYMRQYTKQPLVSKQDKFGSKAVSSASLFFTSCNQPDESCNHIIYHAYPETSDPINYIHVSSYRCLWVAVYDQTIVDQVDTSTFIVISSKLTNNSD